MMNSTSNKNGFNLPIKGIFFLLFILSISSASFALTTRTWTGATNSNFNTATNWSPSAVPSSGDSCVIIVSGNLTISLSGNITIGALYIKETGNAKALVLDMVSYLLTINGNLHSICGGNASSTLYIDLGSSTGGVTVGRHAFLDDGGVGLNRFYADVTSPGIFTFKGNVTIGPYAHTTPGDEPDMIYNGTGTQTVIPNNTYSYFLGEDVTIGTTNNPTVNVSGATINAVGCYDGGVTINGTSVLDINAHYFNCYSGGGYFTMNSTSTLKIAGTNSFPDNYGSYSLNAASNTYYDGTTQTVSALTYGNLYLATSGTKSFNSSSTINGNLTTSGTVTADINAALDINGNVVIGSGTTVLGGSSITSTVAGSWTNSGTFTKETSTITFDGTATSTVSATSSTFTIPGTTLLTESFENLGAIPANWNEAIVTDAGTDPDLTFVTLSTNPVGFIATAGTYFVKFNSFSAASGSQSRLKRTSSFSTTGLTNIVVSFDWTNDNGYTNADKVNVQYSTDGTTWTTAGSNILRYTGASNSWTNQSVTLPVGAENQATLYIAFLFTSAYGNDCYLDNVVVTGGPTTETYAGESFNNFKISKTGAGSVSLASKIMIGSSLNFNGGIIAGTSSYYTEFDEDAVVAGTPSSTSHVNNTVLKRTNTTTKFTYPVGNGTIYRSIATTPSTASATVWTVNYIGAGHSDTDVESTLDNILTQEYWNVGRSGTTPADAVLEVTWIAATGVTDYTRLTIAHYDGTTDWDKITSAAVGNNTSGVLTSSAAVSTFSPFTIAELPAIALPVALVSFEGKNEGVSNVLNWVTATELNSDYFTVERSVDGKIFLEVGKLAGAGTSTSEIHYTLTDNDFRNELNYYRLKQTDYDGEIVYSEIISIDNRIGNKTISKIININGQEVSSDYKGQVIIIYSDNTILRTVQGL